jgi:hypothetical protein
VLCFVVVLFGGGCSFGGAERLLNNQHFQAEDELPGNSLNQQQSRIPEHFTRQHTQTLADNTDH